MAVAGALVVSLIVAELGLRVLGITYPILVEPEPIAGIRLRPFVEGWFTEEGRGYVVANDLGYRDDVHPVEKPPDHFRIAFLGDSYTEALQVPLDEAWWRLVGRDLAACEALAPRVVEVMNFAVSGIGTAQQLEIYRQIASRYSPDLVVLAFVPNDLENNHPAFGGVGLKPFYGFDPDGALVLDDSFKRDAGFQRRTSWSARLARTISAASRVLQLALEMRRVLARIDARDQQAALPTSSSAEPTSPVWIEAWALTEALIAELARQVADAGSELLLVAVSSPHQVHPDPEYRRRRLVEIEKGTDLLYWNKRLGRLAEREGIAYLSLSEPFQLDATATGRCLHGFENMLPCDGHWNRDGHRLAADLVATAICDRIPAPARSDRDD
jgi:hypothetical protein